MLFPPQAPNSQSKTSDQTPRDQTAAEQPLAARLRPNGFDEVVGQEKIWGQTGPLRRLVEAGKFYSLIFWGPPGTGKTSVATLIGQHDDRPLTCLSAVHTGVKEIRTVLETSQKRLKAGKNASLLFLDEVHRLSKSQQDVLLPALEEGSVKFIGATTENPSFTVNAAILSRSLVFNFAKLSPRSLIQLFKKAHATTSVDLKQGTGPIWEEDALEVLALACGGDARTGLNLFEAVQTLCADKKVITRQDLKDLHSQIPLLYDRSSDQHYDCASALIKSIRASHPDAALYYLARMLEGGEDPLFIARRLVIAAAEDIGNANPHALTFATSAALAVQQIGMPESRIILGQICTLLAASPKSNRAYCGIEQAIEAVKKWGAVSIPLHLRNAPTSLMRSFDYGKGYAYPPDEPQKARNLSYLPAELKGQRFYEPSDKGFEANIKQTLSAQRPQAD